MPVRTTTAPASTAMAAPYGSSGRPWKTGCGTSSISSRSPTCCKARSRSPNVFASASTPNLWICRGRCSRWARPPASDCSCWDFHTGNTMTTATSTIQELANREYQHGFVTDIETETVPRGLNEDIIRLISAKKHEPDWLLQWRLKAFRHWLTMEEPRWWPHLKIAPIDYQDIIYYSAPKAKKKLNSLDEVDPELRRTFEKLGISLDEQKRLTGVAVDAVFDSVSVTTTFKKTLAEK